MMEANKQKFLKKKLLLDYLIAKLFDTSNNLAEKLAEIEEQKKNEDPFVNKTEVKVESEPKPLKFLSNNGGERFKALRTKALMKENQTDSSNVEVVNAETEQ